MTLSLLRGVGAASRGTATLGAAAVLPYRAESFGIFVPDDDPEEPGRALACDEHLKAETCRVAGCKWDKPTATCDDWPLQNSNMGKPTPPKIPETLAPSQNPETLSPTTPTPTAKPTTPAPTAKPTVKPSPPTTTTMDNHRRPTT